MPFGSTAASLPAGTVEDRPKALEGLPGDIEDRLQLIEGRLKDIWTVLEERRESWQSMKTLLRAIMRHD